MNKGTVFKTAVGIFIIAAFSKTMGFFREMMIAYRFGAGMGTDAFYIADSINSVIFRLAGAGLALAVIPVLSRVKEEQNEDRVKKYIWTLCLFFAVIASALMILTLIFTEPLVKLFAVGFTGERLALAVRMTRLGIPIIFLNFLYAIFEAYNQSEGRFYIPASSGFFLNAPIITYLVFFHNDLGLPGLVISMVFGYLLRLLYLYRPVHPERIYRQGFSFKDEYLKSTMNIMVPIMLTSMVRYVNVVVDKTLASKLVPGSISALSYASRTMSAIDVLFVASLVTVLFPQFSQAVSIDNQYRLKRMFTYGLNSIILIVVPVTIGIVILHKILIRVVFMHGAFDETAAGMTAAALLFYAIGVAGQGTSVLINKVYYAFHDSKTTMRIGVLAVVLNIVLNLLLVQVMAHRGLALATSIVVTFSAALKFYLLKDKPMVIEYRRIGTTALKALFASVIMGGALVGTLTVFDIRVEGSAIIQFIKLLALCVGSAGLYGLLVYWMKVDEVRELTQKIVERIRRRQAA